jgi:4-hydroxyphenylacetate 3-monooxygenase
VPGEPNSATPDTIAFWLFWHQLYAWLAKAEVTLGLALACTEVMGLRENAPTLEYLVDLLEAVQTVRTCQTAAETDPEFTAGGLCLPRQVHVAAGSLALLKARQSMSEILRILPGSSLVVAPSQLELVTPELSAALEESFGGGGFSALQRSAVLQMTWDHVSSGLDGRESAFELHANGGIPAWRARLRRHFADYNQLANGVLKMLAVEMPEIDLSSLRQVQSFPRRLVTPSTAPAEASEGETKA